jgi:SNF2 family DNA or RNA helicase
MQLRPYQEFGAKFAVAVRRGVLSDDMGLGKTVQSLAAIAHATEIDGERYHIVVCPASLIDTWLREIQRALTGVSGWRFARSTARRAVAWLREQNLIETVPTRGSYVV